jgi:3-dehydroquinate dehydratase/shikimate dehydrogenase
MGNTRETPLQEKEINARYVFDMIYDPGETQLLKLAKQRGAQIIPGIEMFVHQAARQFEIWTGKPAPQDDMLQVVAPGHAGTRRPSFGYLQLCIIAKPFV